MVLLPFATAAVVLLAAGLVFFALSRRDYLERGRLRLPTIVLGIAVFFGWGAMGWIFLPRDWPAVHVGTARALVGRILLWGGLAAMLLGIVWLGVARSCGQRRDRLRTSGPYRLSRNPQCVACASFGAGFLVLWPSVWTLVWLGLLLGLLALMVRTEEEHLQRLFGDEYAAYRARVPRWLRLPGRGLS